MIWIIVVKDDILDDLVVNKEHYKIILAPLIETLDYLLENEDKVFKDDVLSQFEDTAKWVIAKNIHNRFNITIEDAYILLEHVSIRSYL
jgi:hemoglobin-like flavoprotein